MVPSRRDTQGSQGDMETREVRLPPTGLSGTLRLPPAAKAMVVFVHGSGSSRFSPRNNAVAAALNGHAIATLLFDLLTQDEEGDRRNVFDIALLTRRLVEAVGWVDKDATLAALPLGLFGASTGAAAALVAAAELGPRIGAVVSRGGRPDLADAVLGRVTAPTLLIVGGADIDVLRLNERAYQHLNCVKELHVVPRATHLFPEPGALEEVIDHAARWFVRHLTSDR